MSRKVHCFFINKCPPSANFKYSMKNRVTQSAGFLYIKTYCHVDRDASVSVHILLLHHYKSDLAHLLDFDSLVIEVYNAKRCAKNN